VYDKLCFCCRTWYQQTVGTSRASISFFGLATVGLRLLGTASKTSSTLMARFEIARHQATWSLASLCIEGEPSRNPLPLSLFFSALKLSISRQIDHIGRFDLW
jgi:hypothetical protein